MCCRVGANLVLDPLTCVEAQGEPCVRPYPPPLRIYSFMNMRQAQVGRVRGRFGEARQVGRGVRPRLAGGRTAGYNRVSVCSWFIPGKPEGDFKS
jgi:hypothetical protein